MRRATLATDQATAIDTRVASARTEGVAGYQMRARREVQVSVPGPEPPQHPERPAQVVDGSAPDVDPAVGVVDPVDRHLVDAQPVVLGEQQQLRVEEPVVVLDERQQRAGDIGTQGLEPALRVVHAGLEGAPQDRVVRTGDELALRATRDRRAR